LAALDLTLAPQKLTAAQLAPINKAIAAQQKNLTAVGVLLNKDTSLTSQYNRETKTIASLEAQLAKAKSKTAIQKKLNAAEALQAKILSQGNSAFNTALTDLNTFDTQITTIVSQYNALVA
jgi:lipase chaperone LimK